MSAERLTSTDTPVVRAEVNLLRFPLFALATKGLRTLDGIECRGTVRRNGEARPYQLRVTRNTGSLYPGPLARRVHWSLVALATESGLPIANPVVFTWRDLCRRMGIAYAGQTSIDQIKAAIRSTHGIIIHSEEALMNRSTGTPLPATERGYHLYETYIFANEPNEDGTVADANAVWFADWYAENLNRLYAAPVDFVVWQQLDRKSTIASRLYEFLLLAFHSGTPVLRINYANLARLLPVRPEKYESLARKQMEPALHLLAEHGVVANVRWETSARGEVQLVFHRLGPVSSSGAVLAPAEGVEQTAEISHVRELRAADGPEVQVVRAFYQLRNGSPFNRPTPREIEHAAELVAKHGLNRALRLVEYGEKQLRIHWPEAKSFGAFMRYLPEAEADLLRSERRAERERLEREQLRREEEESSKARSRKEELIARWQPVWNGLPADEQQSIERIVEGKFPLYRRIPRLFEQKCLEELSAQQESSSTA